VLLLQTLFGLKSV